MNDLAKLALSTAKAIQDEVPLRNMPPEKGPKSTSEHVLAFSLVRDTREYIEQVTNQINGCYENGWFDACAVMIRRLVETLIIEVAEHQGIGSKIKDSNGYFVYLNELVNIIVAETALGLSRSTITALPRLKKIGDLSAHSRRFIAHRRDIEKIMDDLRVVSQELIFLADFKRAT